MKYILMFIIVLVLFCSCSKNSSPTSPINNAKNSSHVYIAGMIVGDSSISSLIYNDTICIPLTLSDARLVVTEVDTNFNVTSFTDSVIWNISNSNIMTISASKDSDVFIINSTISSSTQSPNIVIPVYCRIGSIISDTEYIQILYNSSRFNYSSIEFSDGAKFKFSRIKQWGRSIDLIDSLNTLLQNYLFVGSNFQGQLGDYKCTTTLININSTFSGTFINSSTNKSGTWILK